MITLALLALTVHPDFFLPDERFDAKHLPNYVESIQKSIAERERLQVVLATSPDPIDRQAAKSGIGMANRFVASETDAMRLKRAKGRLELLIEAWHPRRFQPRSPGSSPPGGAEPRRFR